MKQCVISGDGFIVFNLEDASDVHINLAPMALNQESDSILSYRLINKKDRQKMKHALSLMGIGFVLVLGLLIVMFKAFNLM